MYAPFVSHHLAGSPRKVLGPSPRPFFEYVGAGAGAGAGAGGAAGAGGDPGAGDDDPDDVAVSEPERRSLIN